MARLDRAINWSGYQEAQLRTLESIDKSLRTNLEVSKLLATDLHKIEYSITSMAKASEYTASTMYSIAKDLGVEASRFSGRMDGAGRAAAEFNRKLKVTTATVEDLHTVIDDLEDAAEETSNSNRETASKTQQTVQKVLDTVIKHMSLMGKEADKYSEISNNFIKLSGRNGTLVREFRSGIVDTVSELNRRTDYAYNGQESYANLLSYTQGITSNLEAIDEMARPLLLAQETLNIDMHNVAELFNKFYTRYSFSSINMEDTLNEIRGNTAGNSANEAATAANIKSLENWIQYNAGNDTEKMQSMMEEISHYTSWLESMNVESAPYTEMLNQIAWGDYSSNPVLANILTRGGLSTHQATLMAREGQYEEVTKVLMEGIYSAFSTIDGSAAMGMALDNMGLDRNMSIDAWNVMNSNAWKSLDEFITESSKHNESMESLVEDKYISAQQKMINHQSTIAVKLADMQELIGIGFSDISGLLQFIGTVLIANSVSNLFGKFKGGTVLPGGGKGAGTLAKFIGTAGTASAKGTGLLGGLAKVGSASYSGLSGGSAAAAGVAQIGGVAAGVGMGIYGWDKATKDYNEGKVVQANITGAGALAGFGGAAALGIGAAAGAMGAAGVANAWNPVGWALLIASAATLVGTAIYDAATHIGTVDVIEAAYAQVAASISSQASEQEDALLEIKSEISKYEDILSDSNSTQSELLAAEAGLEEQRKALIESGILSESMIAEARTANAEGLMKLTDAYLRATDQWSTDTESDMEVYKQADLAYGKGLNEELFKQLNYWNDNGYLFVDGNGQQSEELKVTEKILFSLFQDLQDREAAGEVFTGHTWTIYEAMKRTLADGSLDKNEANEIIDAGWINEALKGSNWRAEELYDAVTKAGAMSPKGAELESYVTRNLGNYYGSENFEYVVPTANKIKAGKTTGTMTLEEATAALDQLKAEGYTSAVYPQIGEAAEAWGLSGYAVGTNYIEKDQIALLHEGEAVVPKKYNPAVNSNEFKEVASQLKESQENAKKASEESSVYMQSLISEVQAMKSFLETWKQENVQRENIKEARNRYSNGINYLLNT